MVGLGEEAEEIAVPTRRAAVENRALRIQQAEILQGIDDVGAVEIRALKPGEEFQSADKIVQVDGFEPDGRKEPGMF